MSRFVCCIPSSKKEDSCERQIQPQCNEKTMRISENENPILLTNFQEDEAFTSKQTSPVMDSKYLINRLSVGSCSHPSSISCPQLQIENTEKEDPSTSNMTLQYKNRNNLSIRYNNAGSPSNNSSGNSSKKNQNNLLTHTSSFKRIMSFRSSKRGSEVMNFNFLGQIYRKKSVPSLTPKNCQKEEEEEKVEDRHIHDNFDGTKATLS